MRPTPTVCAVWLASLLSLLSLLSLGPAVAQESPPAAPEEEELTPEQIEEWYRKRTEDPVGASIPDEIRAIESDYGEGVFTFLHGDDVPRPYLIAAQLATNTDADVVAGQFGRILGHLHEQFYREYASMLGLAEIRRPVVVLVFEGLPEYLEILQAKPELGLQYTPGLGGYFDPSNGNLYMWNQPGLWEVMFHEGTHQLMYHALKDRNVPQMALSPWMQEGIAEYFGGHTKEYVKEGEDWRYVFELGGYLPGRHKTLRQAYYHGVALTVRELVHFRFPSFLVAQETAASDPVSARAVQLVYAQGWALVMFLNKAGDGEYEPVFREMLQTEVNGELTGERFGALFSLEEDVDWEEFDAEFKQWSIEELAKFGRNR